MEVLSTFLCDIPRCLQVSEVISKFLPKKKEKKEKRLIFIDFLKYVCWRRFEEVIMRENQWFRILKCPGSGSLQFLGYEEFSHHIKA